MEGSGDCCWRVLVMIDNGKTVELERRQDKEEKKDTPHCILLLLHNRPCEKLGESILFHVSKIVCGQKNIYLSAGGLRPKWRV